MYSFVSIASRLIPNVLIFWILARFFGPTSFGKFSYAHTLANTFLLFADFGFDLLITTEIARKRQEAELIFSQYFWIKIGLSLISLIVMTVFIFLRGGDSESIFLGMIFSFYMLFNTVTNFYVASFKGFERLDYDAKVSISMNVFLLFSSILLFIFYNNILLVALNYVVSRVIGFLYSLRISKRVLPKLSYVVTVKNFRDCFKKAFLYGILILASSFLFQLDTILLGIIRTDYEVGIYQAVKNLMLVPFIVPGVVFSALLPTLARAHKENFENWIHLNSIFFKLIFWLNLPVAILFFVYPDSIIELLYGAKDYSSAIPILRVFAIILFLRSTSDYVGVMLITSNRQKVHIYTSLLCIPLNIFSSILLLPTSGVFGASLVYFFVVTIISAIYLYTSYDVFFKKVLNSKYLIMLLTAVITAYILQNWFAEHIFLGILILAFVFILLIFIVFDKNERITVFSTNAILSFKKESI